MSFSINFRRSLILVHFLPDFFPFTPLSEKYQILFCHSSILIEGTNNTYFTALNSNVVFILFLFLSTCIFKLHFLSPLQSEKYQVLFCYSSNLIEGTNNNNNNNNNNILRLKILMRSFYYFNFCSVCIFKNIFVHCLKRGHEMGV